jgi:hypothetical protein
MTDPLTIDQILGQPVSKVVVGEGKEASLQGQPVPKVIEHPIGNDVLANVSNTASTQPVPMGIPVQPVKAPVIPAVPTSTGPAASLSAQISNPLPLQPQGSQVQAMQSHAPQPQAPQLMANLLGARPQMGPTTTTAAVAKPAGGDVLKNENHGSGGQPLTTTVVAGPESTPHQPTGAVVGSQAGKSLKPLVASPQPLTNPLPALSNTKPMPSPQPVANLPSIPPSGKALPQLGGPSGPQPTPEERMKLEVEAKKMVKELDKAGVGKKVAKPGSGSNKGKMVGGGLAALLILVVGGGMYIGMQYLKSPGSQEDRSKAGGTAPYECESPNGLVHTARSQWNESGNLGFKPASSDPGDAGEYYDVSAGETVEFHVGYKNEGDETINDYWWFDAFKVTQSPDGTAVSEDSPLDEATLFETHLNENKDRNNDGFGDDQEHRFGPLQENYSLAPGEEKTFIARWTPTQEDCGLYQIDFSVGEMKDIEGCYPQAAGFIRVSNCEEAQEELVCEQLNNQANATPALGDTLTLTCVASGTTIHHYNFEASYDGGANYETLISDSVNQTIETVVKTSGNLVYRCQACADEAGTNCTEWEEVQ